MYGWLSDTCDDTSHVVTANRRLARVLAAAYNEQQLAAGRSAWRTASIYSYPDWLSRIIATGDPGNAPTRINAQQSRVLWERAIRGEISDPLVNVASLARQARDAWRRLHDWNVPLEELVASASSRDQRVFARAAIAYKSVLDSNNWLDDALLGSWFLRAVQCDRLQLPSRVTCAGFDRTTPQVQTVLDALRGQGTLVESAPVRDKTDVRMFAYSDPDAEMRAAGAWARAELEKQSDQRIAIVVSDLEQNAARVGRLIRDGFVPGWQYGAAMQAASVNVSYGRRLSEYPAIEIALCLLRWSHRELNGRDISLLLRSSFIGVTATDGRARLELELRKAPDRDWSPERLLTLLTGRNCSDNGSEDATDWRACLSRLIDSRKTFPQSASPAFWAERADAILRDFNWPGSGTLDSDDFQLVNRWRDLLNDLARLELVSPSMTFAEAVVELVSMANETVFQPEVDMPVLQVLGPLEAAGLQFDQLCVAGLTADQWPPPRQPMALLSRRLQRHYSMPDADPLDTTEYALRVVERLAGSAPMCRFSYPVSAGDSEQAPTTLVGRINCEFQGDDAGWHAATLCSIAGTRILGEDPVPAILPDEVVSGGAGTIQQQCSEPFQAFVNARLGVSRLQAIAAGLSPMLRGNLVHGALFHLYEDLPSQTDIRGWGADEVHERVKDAVDRAFLRHERYADRVLRALLALERLRTEALLAAVLRVDRERDAFAIDAVEASVDINLRGVPLSLRIDRIDRFEDAAIAILDYKTGAPKRFLDGSGNPTDVQLVVYACALADSVADLGLYNIDSRAIAIDGASRASMEAERWSETLEGWTEIVEQAAADLASGDVRLRAWQSARDARALNLISRYGALHRDA
jgi:probable DNA repair protein